MQKDAYPYEHMDDWEKLNETSLPKIEDVYSHLNMEDINGSNYMQIKRVCKNSEIKTLGEYHYLHVQGDILLLVDSFENF